MSEGENIKWGKKGSCLAAFLIAIIFFIIMLIYIYNHNANQLNLG